MATIPIEKVTPAKAEQWINANKNNRKLREGVAERYADDMRNGRWTRCPMPISFYKDGDLADGQHRLFAILESQTTQEFAIVRDLDREDGLNIDTGLNRSIVDNGRISGRDPHLSTTLIGVARGVEYGTQPNRNDSTSAKLEMVAKHREAAEWAVKNGPRSKFLRNAVVLSAIARAYYLEANHDKLKRYCDVLQTGHGDGAAESAAVSMRNYLLQRGAICSTTAMWRDTFLKAQNSIRYFMMGKQLMTIKGISEEVYPLKKRKGR